MAATNNVGIRFTSQNNTSADFDALKAQLADLQKQRAQINVNANDKAAQLALARIDAQIAALSAKTAKPNISMQGGAKAMADIAAVDLAMDALSKKTSSPSEGGGLSGILGGALPGIMGLSGMQATIVGLGGAVAALLPAIVSVGSGLGVIGAGFALAMATSKAFKTQVMGDLKQLETLGGEVVKPLIGPLEAGLNSLMGFFKQIAPELKQMFGDAGPLIQPLIKGFEQLMSGAGPGFLLMIKSSLPVFQAMSGAFADLGKSLGQMFSDFASDGKGSAQMLSGLLDIVNDLLPFIGSLGKILVGALAPAFSALGSALGAVLPALDPMIKILGSLAGAVMTDLASVLGALAKLLVGLAPSFTTLTKVASNLFNTLENTGVFAILADALENLAKPLANLINALVVGLAPALPGIINMISRLSGVLISLVSAGVGTLVNGLAGIVKAIPPPVLAALVDGFIALKVAMFAFNGVQAIYTGIAKGIAVLTAALDIDTLSLKAMYLWDGLVTIATKAWAVAETVLNAIMDMNPWVAIGAAIVVLVALIIKYHTQILAFIEKTWKDIETFLKTTWTDIENVAKSVWNAISSFFTKWYDGNKQMAENAWNALKSFFTTAWNDIKKVFTDAASTIESALATAWDKVTAAIKTAWNAIVNWFKGIPGDIVKALGNLGSLLVSAGKDVVNGLWSGAKSVWNSVVSFFENIPKDILNALGIHSPPAWAIQAGKDIMGGLGIGIGQAQEAVKNATATLASTVTNALTPTGGGNVQKLMQQMAAAKGWTGSQWTDLYNVEMREAGFSLTATNQSSGAYGLAQFINGPSEYAQYGGNANTASGQITGMLNYISQRYGTPASAWQHELDYGWYDQGGWLPTGASIAINNTGAPERILGPGQGSSVVLEISPAGNSAFEQFMTTAIKQWVRIKGGGNVQTAFGRN